MDVKIIRQDLGAQADVAIGMEADLAAVQGTRVLDDVAIADRAGTAGVCIQVNKAVEVEVAAQGDVAAIGRANDISETGADRTAAAIGAGTAVEGDVATAFDGDIAGAGNAAGALRDVAVRPAAVPRFCRQPNAILCRERTADRQVAAIGRRSAGAVLAAQLVAGARSQLAGTGADHAGEIDRSAAHYFYAAVGR